jgi:hypothetical protein
LEITVTETNYATVDSYASGDSWKAMVFKAAAAAVLSYATKEVVTAAAKAAAPHVKRGVTTLIEKLSKQDVTTA